MNDIENPATCSLAPVPDDWRAMLARELHAIEPWRKLGYSERAFAALMTTREAEVEVRAIVRNDICCGLTIVRNNWLFGPYLRIFAVLPAVQNSGIGSQALDQLCREAAAKGARNLWACVSGFNPGARHFYERNNFETIGKLEDLVIAGEDEFLIRRRLDLTTTA